MATRIRYSMYGVTATFLAFILVLGVLQGCRRKTPATGSTPAEGVKAVPAVAKETAKNPIETAASLFREPKVSIQNIVNAGKDRWTAAFEQWWDKPAPDFTLTDTDGQTHKLSDYRGQDVVVFFWKTWIGACKMEIPHLKQVRDAYSKDKLAILAISDEPTALVKAFAADQGVNYTLLTSSGSLPTPFDQVKLWPSNFFIGPDGRFKLVIEGMVPAADSKAIIQAQ
jgi:peroxiredoxin